MSISQLSSSHRVMKLPFGDVLGCSYRWPQGQYCAVHTDKGILGCGLYDCQIATKFGMAVAIARGTPEHPLFEPEDLLNARIAEVSDSAAALGIRTGMSGLEALQHFCSQETVSK